MSANRKHRKSILAAFSGATWILLLLFFTVAIQAQTNTKKSEPPVFQDYKGVKIGTAAGDVRVKLGKAQSDDKDGFLYVFENDETAQIMLDANQKVSSISIMYGGDCPKQPKFEEVFGKTIEPEKQESGAIYKLIKYAADGYWLSYNRNAGEKPMVMIVMQKLQ